MVEKLLAITIMLSCLPCAGQQSPWPDAFSRRNYQLGISISQFRALPYPDQEEWPNAYPVCSDEARSQTLPFLRGLLFSSDWKSAGVVKCSFFYDNEHIFKSTESAGLVMGDLNSLTSFFFVSEDGRQEARLFLVKSGAPTDYFEDLVGAFTTAIGKPVKTSKESVQTQAGSTFENVTVTWENKSSLVELQRFAETTQVLEVRQVLKPLMATLQKRLAEIQAAKAKKL